MRKATQVLLLSMQIGFTTREKDLSNNPFEPSFVYKDDIVAEVKKNGTLNLLTRAGKDMVTATYKGDFYIVWEEPTQG